MTTQIVWGLLLPFLGTVLGAGCVFFLRRQLRRSVQRVLAGFAAGVTLADGTKLSPAEVTALSDDGRTVRVVLHQGVYHQIKRMFGVYGAGVDALHRESIGGVPLDQALAPGQWRELTGEEVARIAGR